ncbi:Heat-stable enterotoxin II [Citrobacter braakii]|uniref:Heat-stable enterotoxin II n=1 Tax=Citrobacter braakii TaxID=57706 RepID=UPI000907D6F3|nr:Heat-stable enterotoxin II [Citrobacter braakii]
MNKYIAIMLLATSTITFNSYAQPQANSPSRKKDLCEHYRQIAKESCKKGVLGVRDGTAGACFGAQLMVTINRC